jgi:hypothetical protein
LRKLEVANCALTEFNAEPYIFATRYILNGDVYTIDHTDPEKLGNWPVITIVQAVD